jgi:phage terminase large subunit GpA-like protein
MTAATATAADPMAAVSPESRRAMAMTVARALRVLRIPSPMRLSQWAEKHFYLSTESSYVEGRWVCWPFQRGIMDVLGHDEIHHVTVRKSARVGYTKMALALLAYTAEHKRRNAVIYQPTDDDRDEFVTTELDPMLRDVRAMRSVMPRFSRRSKDNTLRVKKFTTGLLHMRGGKAAKNFRRLTVDTVVYDEFSGFDRDIEKEGSPGKLGDKRLEGAVWPKSIAGSTPKLKHNDNTEDREAEADVHLRWHVPCPHCGELHQITFGGKDKHHGLKWLPGDTASAVHICPHCGGAMSQAEYLRVWHAGVWICERTGQWLDHLGDFRAPESLRPMVWELQRDPATILQPPGHVAVHVWTACAPQATWAAIAEEATAAGRLAERGDMSLLKTFVNTTLGETWEEKGESADEHALQARAEDYPLTVVPKDCLMLTAGCDLQGNRCEIAVWGWGVGLESWDVDHIIIEMNPSAEEDWLAVEQHLLRRYQQAWHGGTLPLSAISFDSNYQTQAVYNFVRRMQHRMRIHAVRGEGAENLPIKGPGRSQEVNWKGGRWPNGIKQWSVGVDAAKDLLHGQLQITEPGPGYVHMNKARPREWFEQLTAEQRVLARGATGLAERWIKRRPRNEVLDCRNYALHAAYMLGLHQYVHKDWVRLEQAVQPPADLFTSAPAAAPIVVPGGAKPATAPAVPMPPPQRPARAVAAGRSW